MRAVSDAALGRLAQSGSMAAVATASGDESVLDKLRALHGKLVNYNECGTGTCADSRADLFEADAYFIRGDWTVQGQFSVGQQKQAAITADPTTGELRTAKWWGLSGLAAYKWDPRFETTARLDFINNKKNGGGLLGYGADNVNGIGPNPANWIPKGTGADWSLSPIMAPLAPVKEEITVVSGVRFVRDGKGWRAFVSVRETHAEPVGDTALGALGVDVNADHLAVAVADPHGNPVAFRSMPTPVVGMRADCRDAIYGDAAKVIVDMALARRVPIVLESLDFRRKRAELETSMSPRYARMLSGLAYAQIGGMIRARAMRLGVRVIERNPAYTSLIGDVKFSARYGVSIHLSAALAIARLRAPETYPVPCNH